MLEAGCGSPVVPSFSSFFTATVQWVLAEELTQMGIISGNSNCSDLWISLKLSGGFILRMTGLYFFFKTLFTST